MTKFFSLISLIGLFSVLCFTHCKKKNDSPTATVNSATLTGATNGWTITGLTADKPMNPSVPTSTDWYKELGLSSTNPTFTFRANKTYSLLPDIGYIPSSGAWSLNDANTVLTISGLEIKFTQASSNKIVGTIVYPKYAVNQIANLVITLTAR